MNLTMNTDLYQLTMAYGYWKTGVAEQRAVFDLFFRKNPFKGGFAVAAGLGTAIEFLDNFGFAHDDIEYLATLTGADNEPLFEQGFLTYLSELTFDCDVDAIPEGRIAFPHEPLMRIRGPVAQAQLIETPLLNMMNFQTLIATKAARVCHAAGDDSVLEFGLRRAHGVDGGLSVARAAYVGGVNATSNVLAGKAFGIPVKGTHAHSWVMFFESEVEAFAEYASALPNNCVFLVDTYDTERGVDHAIAAGRKLREHGHEMVGIRLDSGDLAYLSKIAREKLDAAGFPNATVVASNNLDENIIQSLKSQGAQIGVWGVGTKLASAYDQPALGGVYKICAVEENGTWRDTIKISEQAIKVNHPGIHQVRRFFDGETFAGDLIFDIREEPSTPFEIVDPRDVTRRKRMHPSWSHEDLLQPIFLGGEKQGYDASLDAARGRRRDDVARLHESIVRFMNPHEYPVGLDEKLHARKTELMFAVRRKMAEEMT